VNTIGARILQTRGQYVESYWYWISVAVLLGFYIIFNIGFTLGLQFMPGVGKPQAIMSKEELEEKEANRTGADLVSKRSKSSRSQSRSLAAIMSSHGTDAPRLSRSHRSSTSHHPSESDVEEVTVEVKKGMILPFQQLSISFDDVSYFVDMPAEMKSAEVTEPRLQLLNKITGAFRPDVLTALVGVSGAGKSTLMDVLAGRKTGGYIEGDIRISGYPKNQKTFARISGYCEQNDIHSPQVTVRESLIYSAWLRLASDIDDESKMVRSSFSQFLRRAVIDLFFGVVTEINVCSQAFVEEVLELVELKSLENALVGLPGITGLSTEQRKRLTIAVELVANPSIIFMDEPTSGLDARAAAIVMRCVRNTVDTGRTVVCTIHQPSIDIFEAFDEVIIKLVSSLLITVLRVIKLGSSLLITV
jgi:ABC-type multidrug transport system ATPase subunit